MSPSASLALAAAFGPAPAPLAYGYVDCMRERAGYFEVGGWLLAPDGGFDGLIGVDRTGAIQPLRRTASASVASACPDIPGSEHCAFFGAIEIPAGQTAGLDIEFCVLGLRDSAIVARLPVHYHTPDHSVELPPSDVMARATGHANGDLYLATGVWNCNAYLTALRRHREPASVRTLLDWGCGAGRVARHLVDRLPDAAITGTDIDAEAVRWAASHLRGQFVPCGTSPPLPFGEARFDAIVATSVFTHLREDDQHLWLAELRRLLTADGVVLATTHGEFAGRWTFRAPGRFERVFATGFCAVEGDDNLRHVASADYYRRTYQSQAWTERTWGRYFRVAEHIAGGLNNYQDIWVLRPRAT